MDIRALEYFHAEAGLIRCFCAETHITDLSEYAKYSSCGPCHMCSGALVWAKIGTLVYGASDKDLCRLLGVEGSECSKTVFEQTGYRPTVGAGVLKEESMRVLKEYERNRTISDAALRIATLILLIAMYISIIIAVFSAQDSVMVMCLLICVFFAAYIASYNSDGNLATMRAVDNKSYYLRQMKRKL